mgnify:CR=1 FL=1
MKKILWAGGLVMAGAALMVQAASRRGLALSMRRG